MPFTFSHPALVLPFWFIRKNYISINGLIAGSIAPDFEYFIRMRKGDSLYSHTLLSFFYFNLPVALLITVVFHQVIRRPLLDHLPYWLQRRFYFYYQTKWLVILKSRLPFIILSIAVGFLTHIVWDWHVHTSAMYIYQSQHLNFLLLSYPVIYKSIHAIHSLVGMIILLIIVFRMPSDGNIPILRYHFPYWQSIAGIAMLIFVLRYVLGPSMIFDDIITSIFTAVLMAIVITSGIILKK